MKETNKEMCEDVIDNLHDLIRVNKIYLPSEKKKFYKLICLAKEDKTIIKELEAAVKRIDDCEQTLKLYMCAVNNHEIAKVLEQAAQQKDTCYVFLGSKGDMAFLPSQLEVITEEEIPCKTEFEEDVNPSGDWDELLINQRWINRGRSRKPRIPKNTIAYEREEAPKVVYQHFSSQINHFSERFIYYKKVDEKNS